MRISYSACQTYVNCNFQYFLHYFRKLRPEYSKSPLIFGDAIDQGLNHLLKTKNLEESLNIFNEAWDKIKGVTIEYSKSDLDEKLLPEQEYKNEQEKSWMSLRVKGNIILTEYNIQVLPNLKEVIEVQLNDVIKNHEDDELIIKTDFIAVYKDGRRILFDNKTSSVKYEDNSVRESEQLAIYYEAFKVKYKLDACGYVVIPKRINRKKKPAIEIKFIIDNIPEETIDKSYQQLDNAMTGVKQGHFPKNPNSCIGKYGKCVYFNYCHSNNKTGLIEK